MNAKRLFEDDDTLFGDSSNDRDSHVELRLDLPSVPPTEPILEAASDYFQLVPYLTVKTAELTLLPLDHREGFVLSHVDGQSTIETILDVCAMSADDAIEIIVSLVERGIIDVR